MWDLKKFTTSQSLEKWRKRNASKYQIVEVYINNGYALEVKRHVRIH